MHSFRSGVSSSFFCSFMLLVVGAFWSKNADSASVRLTWKDTSTVEQGFKIERLTGSQYVTLATVGPNTQNYTDSSVDPGTAYCYRVSAFNSIGVSLASNAACTTATSQSTSLVASIISPQTPRTASEIKPIALSGTKWTDYRLRMNIRTAQLGGFGVIFRYRDRGNHYRFLWDHKKKTRRLEKQVDGTVSILAQNTAAAEAGGTYALDITADGPSIKVRIDGKTIISVLDSSLPSGTIALYSYNDAASSFDDVSVQEIPTGKTLLFDSFDQRILRGWTITDDSNGGSQRSQWSAISGALARSDVGSGQLGAYALFTRGPWRDYGLTLKMHSGASSGSGVMFRFEDSDNYYRFSCGGDGRRLIKREQGVAKVIAEDSIPCIPGKTYRVQILAQGTSLQVKIDDASIFIVDDDSFTTGTIALYASANTSTAYDDVLVQEIPSGNVLLEDDFSKDRIAGWTIFDVPGAASPPSDWKIVNQELVQSNISVARINDDTGTLAIY